MPQPGSPGGRPLLDISSYARRGPGRRDKMSPAELEAIELTVNRTPEVMVKVLTKGGQNLKAMRAHLTYLSRGGELEIETDDGDLIAGREAEKGLLDDWNLDLEEHRRDSKLTAATGRVAPKLAHKVLFSMPPGTPPDRVLGAVRNLAREEFGLKHRYAMVLHTDEPHPHVHLVVKAVSEEGVRLNIRKATLRDWRRQFARNLRTQGVGANASDRAVRGQIVTPKKDGIYRTELRGDSRHLGRSTDTSPSAQARNAHAQRTLMRTRSVVQAGWAAVSGLLRNQGYDSLAEASERFAAGMTLPRTDFDQSELLVTPARVQIGDRSRAR
jgi:hypothetical protein